MGKQKSLLKTSAAAIGLLHCINKYIDSTSIANNATKTNGKYYNWKHGDIYYKVSGQGDPLLLIHDLTVFSSNYEWSKIMDALSDTYTVYAIDLIGCGKSDKPAITYTNYFYVQMLFDFVSDVIGVNKNTKVAATGLSSSFVLMANSIHPELFNDIMLINPKTISFLKQSPDERSKILIQLFNLPVIGKTAYYMATNKQNTEYYLTEKCFYNPFNLSSNIIKSYYDASHTSNGNGKMLLASLEGNYLNADITKALKNTENKIVIVTGDHNENKDLIRTTYSKINPNLVFETISDSKMLPQLERIDEMIELMYIF